MVIFFANAFMKIASFSPIKELYFFWTAGNSLFGKRSLARAKVRKLGATIDLPKHGEFFAFSVTLSTSGKWLLIKTSLWSNAPRQSFFHWESQNMFYDWSSVAQKQLSLHGVSFSKKQYLWTVKQQKKEKLLPSTDTLVYHFF